MTLRLVKNELGELILDLGMYGTLPTSPYTRQCWAIAEKKPAYAYDLGLRLSGRESDRVQHNIIINIKRMNFNRGG